MDDNTSNNAKNVMVATAVGVLAGTVLGILIAPRSGRETRDLIKERTQRSVEDMQAKLAEIRYKLANKIEDLRELSHELVGEAKVQSQELIRRAEILKADLKATAVELSESVGEARDAAVIRMRQLTNESNDVMRELNRTSKELARTTKDKLKTDKQ
jgi:gas vesicle protein